jgi:hypothetical protein
MNARPSRSILFTLIALALACSAGATAPTSLGNNDSCDIGLTPAATLLLPYFEVAEDRTGDTTLFTVTNVTNVEQIARVTLWTDRSYPVITFNLYLTGFDVQSINLWDVLSGFGIAHPNGTGTSVSHTGRLSGTNVRLDRSNCQLISPGIDASTAQRMQQAFTLGTDGGLCDKVGGVHENAVGYATIDVVGNCSTNGPADPEYFTEDIRYDNVLLGDYQHVNSAEDFAHGGPMVHIRAIPEGHTPQTRALFPTRFDRTFYGRFQPPAHRLLDARQPLPSTFAARWINDGNGQFQTSLRIWREGVTTASANCADFDKNERVLIESVAFDMHENGEGNLPEGCDALCIGPDLILLPSTASIDFEPGMETFPQVIISDTVSGWVYVNLEDESSDNGAHQGWVVASMRAESRYAVDMDAAWLGNGCSPIAPLTSYTNPALPLVGSATYPTPAGAILPGPAADVNP